MTHTRVRLPARATLAAIAALLAVPVAAAAHAEFAPDTAKHNATVTLTLTVPDERGDADHTVKVAIRLPIEAVRPLPAAGWTSAIAGGVLTYTADTPGASPGAFRIRLGPLPATGDTLRFPTVQTYSSGAVVRWIEPTPANGEEPDFPLPTVTLKGSVAAPPPATTGAAAGASSGALQQGTETIDQTNTATTDASVPVSGPTTIDQTNTPTTDASVPVPGPTTIDQTNTATTDASVPAPGPTTIDQTNTPTTAAATTTTAASDGGTSGWLIAAIVVALGALGGAAVLLLRRRRGAA